MNKKEIQKRVLKDGKPLALSKFTWCEKTRTFSSNEYGLILDFRYLEDCTFDTGSECTFDTGSDCTFDTASNCTFEGIQEGCVIIRRDEFEVIQPQAGDIIQLCPYDIKGYLVNGLYNGEPHIIADGILSKVVNQKGDVYRVVNHGEDKQSYIVKSGDVYSHGATLEEARDSLVYKISDRDTSKYEGLTVDSEVTFAEAVAMYRTVTGACEKGVRYFVEQNEDKKKDKYTVKELLDLTKGAYGSDRLKEFIK